MWKDIFSTLLFQFTVITTLSFPAAADLIEPFSDFPWLSIHQSGSANSSSMVPNVQIRYQIRMSDRWLVRENPLQMLATLKDDGTGTTLLSFDVRSVESFLIFFHFILSYFIFAKRCSRQVTWMSTCQSDLSISQILILAQFYLFFAIYPVHHFYKRPNSDASLWGLKVITW